MEMYQLRYFLATVNERNFTNDAKQGEPASGHYHRMRNSKAIRVRRTYGLDEARHCN
jgi:hypothetical protein